jgi:chromosome segregation ATPase
MTPIELEDEIREIRRDIGEIRKDLAGIRESVSTHAERFRHPCERHEQTMERLGALEAKRTGALEVVRLWLPAAVTVAGWFVLFILSHIK